MIYILKIKFFIKKLIINFLSYIINNKNYFFQNIYFDCQHQRKLTIIENKYGERFVLFTKDKVVSREIFVNGEFDFEKFKKTIKFLSSKSKVENLYDIGANIGTICIPAIKRQIIQKAIAVEPEPKNFQILKTNIVLNNLENKITALNYAISNQNDKYLKMELSNDNFGDHRIKNKIKFNIHNEEKRSIVQVKSKTFDSLFKNTLSNKDLVWIDTQGHEANILLGANKLIKKKIPIVIEFWPYALKRNNMWEKMFSILNKFDFFVDLSNTNFFIKKINKKNLDNLKIKFEEEKKGHNSFFTDLILLKE